LYTTLFLVEFIMERQWETEEVVWENLADLLQGMLRVYWV
jgi:hypothetical protein